MDQVVLGLSITVIGCLIVLAGFAMIIGGVILMRNAGKAKAAAENVKSHPTSDLPVVLSAAVAAVLAQEEQERLIAVLTAAVAAMWDENQGGFVVRKVRRVQNSPAWQKAGREEQIYSQM